MKKLAKLAFVLAAIAATTGIGLTAHGAPILLKAKTIVPGEDQGKTRLTSTSSTGGSVESLPERGLYIVQHDGIIQPAWREGLEAAGAIIRSYIPENAYLVEASPTVHEVMRTTIPHTYLGEYKGEYRYDASSIVSLQNGTRTTSDSSGTTSPTKEFSILLFTEECRDEIVEKIGKLSGCSVSGADGKVIRAALTAAAVKDVASWPDVNWVEEFVLPTLCNNVAVQAPRMNVETVWPNGNSGLGLTGEGQVVAVADTGLDNGKLNSLHKDVAGRVTAYAWGRSNDWSDPDGHGTHVAGSVVGDGTRSGGKIKGVAYKANLVFQSTMDSDGYLTGIPNDLHSLFNQAYGAGARIHSDSWGSGNYKSNKQTVLGVYSADCNAIDDFMFTHPDMLILFASGNNGVDWDPQDGVVDEDSLCQEAASKNSIAVGNAENYRETGGFAWGTYKNWWSAKWPVDPINSDYFTRPPNNSTKQGMAASSGRGPCNDGRIKPDIVAPGQQVLSMLSSAIDEIPEKDCNQYDAYYQYLNGTSMACPLVAGSAVLVREWLQTKHTPKISNPDGATIKAILLAGAKSLAPGQYGEGKTQEIPKSYPDNVEGWGQVNLGNSIVNANGLLVYDGKVIEKGKSHTFTVNATAGKSLNIVMAYTDAPGNPGSGKALVNNLDLLVKTPSGKPIYPNSKNSADDINNVEGVRIASAESGVYTITVTAKAINQAMSTSHTGGKANATRYSLVVNGATEKDPVPDPPANDDVANANAITLQNGYTSGSNVAATKDNEGIGGYASVWWKWTVLKSGTATLDTEGSSFDTTLMVYTKLANGTYKLVRENNDVNASVSYSRVEFETTAETTYYVAVGGVSGKTGNIRLNYGLQLVQKPDLCFALGSGNSSWPAAVFLSNARGSTTPETSFKSRQTIYTYWSCKNTGNVSVKSGFVVLHEILKSGTVVQTWTESLSATDESFKANNPDTHFTNLGEGSYIYRIRLDNQHSVDELNENNNEATYSFTVQAPPTPAAPTNFRIAEVNASDGARVQLTWDRVTEEAAAYIDGYYVYRSTSATMPSKPWRTVYGNAAVDTTCSANTKYYYWVAAFLDSKIGTPVSGSITPATSGAASAFTASASVSGTYIKLEWSGSEGGTRIYIYRSTDGICPAKEIKMLFLGFSQTPVTEWIDESVEPGVKYYYWVMLSNYGDIYSDRLSATVPVQKADLGFYQWSGWPKAVFLSDSPSEAREANTFKSGQSVYLWSCWGNFGYKPVPNGWKMRHQVLDRASKRVMAEKEDSSGALTVRGTDGSAMAYEHAALGVLQNLPAGRYVYRATLDADNAVDESDESNNDATFDFEVVNENCDFQYCGYSGWLSHLFLSQPGSQGAYVPVFRYAVGGSPDVNFGVVNWPKTICLCRMLDWRILDSSGNVVKDAEVEWNEKFTADDYHSMSYGWQWPCAFENLTPGTYSLQIVLDSGMDANDTDRGNNTNSVVFAVTNALNAAISSALEADKLNFATSGRNPPFVQTQVASDGADAVQFGPAAPNETNTLSTVVTGPGRLSFRWFCACESAQSSEGHRFAFYVDGAMKRRIYGDGRPDSWKWISYTCDIPAGQHTLSWAYCKDAYADKYLDSAWLDQVLWTPYITPVMPTAKSISGDESGVRIVFGSSANATGYKIYRAETKSLPDDNYDEIPASSGTTLEYPDISASPGVEYHYWISAVGTGGESDAVYCGTDYRRVSIGVSPDDVSFDANGGEKNVSVWANAEWEVQSKPDWLTATKKTIEVDDRSEVVLEISVGETSSEHEGTVKLVAANGTAHPASTDIHVSQSADARPTPPAWTPVNKEDTMVVYATVFDTSANAAMDEAGTRLGAFAPNGECRGWATIMEGPAGRLFQLSVGVESSTESGIVLKVWDPETGGVIEIPERIACNSDKQIGTIANPYVFRIGASELAISIKEGWNWISTCLVADDSSVGAVLAGCTFANDDVVKTSNGAATYYNGTWYPSTYKIDPGVAYVVKKSVGGSETVTLRGALMNDGISVKTGWNWIGMTLMSAQTVSDIRHSGGFANDDIVKNSNAATTYYGGQWYPSTFSINPGMGYKANLTKSGTLSFKVGGAENSSFALFSANIELGTTNDRSANPGWMPVAQEDTMVAYLQVRKPDESGNFESEGSVLAAFSSAGECRGVVEIMDGPAGKVFQLSIGVASATESGFTFKLWDSDSGEVYDIVETLACNSDKLIGKIYAPQVLTVPALSPTTCTVTFNKNGGSGTMADQTVTKDVATPLNKCTFTKTGYSFKEWSGSDGNTYSDQQGVTLSEDLVLTAQWTGNVYRVTFDTQSGSGGSSHVDATYDDAMPSITLPIRADYSFGGYFTAPAGSGTKYYNADGTSAHIWDTTSSTMLYAYWVYDGDVYHQCVIDGITWNYLIVNGTVSIQSPNGGAAITPQTTAGEIVVPARLEGCPVVEIGDDAFSDCTELVGIVMPDSVMNIGDYAFFSCQNLESITIPAGVTGIGTAAFKGCANLESIVFAGNAPVMGNEVFKDVNGSCVIKVSKTSTGWGVDIPGVWNGLQIKYVESDPPTPSMFTVTFAKNGGTGTMPDQKFVEDVEQALAKNAFKKSGYMFVGWKDQNGKEYADEESITPTSDLTLAAQWEKIVVECEPTGAEHLWRGDAQLSGSFDVSCNTEWIASADKSWITLSSDAEGSGDGTIEYSLGQNDGSARKGTIIVASKIDGSVKATFTVNQKARPSAPDLDIQDGVLLGVDMNGYDKLDVPAEVTAIGAAALANNAEIKSIRIPASVTGIGDGAFAGCANLTNVVFDGDAPAVGDGIFTGTPDDLVVTVRNDKTTWPQEGGTWPEGDADARTVAVIKNYIVSFDWNGWEDGPAIEDIVVEPGDSIAELPGNEIWIQDIPVRAGYSFRGWTDGVVTNAPYKGYTPVGSVVLKAVWYAKYYTFKFDANGGKPASQEKFQQFDKSWGDVKDPTLANAVFDGWWTAKTGGVQVDLDDVCAIVGDEKKATTIYAHWRKMFKVTVKDGMVSEDAETYAANVTVLSGTHLYLEAADKSASNMEFSKWTCSPATADFGENFNPRDPNTSITMPSAAVTLTATYVAKPGYVEVATYEVNGTLNDDDDPQGIEWSDDGKVWTPVGDGNAYPVKTGKSVAIQFRSTDPRWTVPAKVNYPIVEGETTDIEVAATRVSVVDASAAMEQLGASGTVTVNPKNGQVLPGKPVTLTAKPGKDAVFAYWTVGGEKVGYSATFKYAPDVDCTATAVFRLKSAVEDPELDASAVVSSENSMVGVAFEMSVPIADAAYPAKFSAKGLPAGLKIDAASGVISGVPTKTGDFVVTVTVAGGVNTKAKSSVSLPITIKPLPEWAQGTFTGYVYGDETDYGFATFAVSAAGKVSGKVSHMGTNWTLSASSYDAATSTWDDDSGIDGMFVVNAELKAGKISGTCRLTVTKANPPTNAAALENAVAYGSSGDDLNFSLFRTIWPKSSKGAFYWEGVYTLSLADGSDYGSGYLSLTVDKGGNVKATGKLADGTSVSATSPLLYDPAVGCFAYLYTAPSAYKGGSFALAVRFGETVGALADMDLSQWIDRNPQSTEEYGEGFWRYLEFTGAYYDKLEKLNAYYEQLRLSMYDVPLLSYTYKYTHVDDDTGRKTTESWLDETDAVATLDQEGLTVAVDGKGALVVAKATKPVQDKETKEWLYNGANDGALTLSFTQATGIFKGSYTFWYDYMSAYDDTADKATWSHTSKKVSFEGIMVQGEEKLRGFYLWDAVGEYEDEKTGKEKTYKYKQSYPVLFLAQ